MLLRPLRLRKTTGNRSLSSRTNSQKSANFEIKWPLPPSRTRWSGKRPLARPVLKRIQRAMNPLCNPSPKQLSQLAKNYSPSKTHPMRDQSKETSKPRWASPNPKSSSIDSWRCWATMPNTFRFWSRTPQSIGIMSGMRTRTLFFGVSSSVLALTDRRWTACSVTRAWTWWRKGWSSFRWKSMPNCWPSANSWVRVRQENEQMLRQCNCDWILDPCITYQLELTTFPIVFSLPPYLLLHNYNYIKTNLIIIP